MPYSLPMFVSLECSQATGGRLATRLIEDWYNGILQHADKSDPRTQSCYQLRGTRPAPAGVGDDHDLIELPSQTHELGGQLVISCFCKYCRYHFAFKWSSRPPVTGPDHLQHHFVIAVGYDESFGEEKGRQTLGPRWDKRRVPLVRQTDYQCSSCGFHIRLEVTAPRLDSRWIDMVTDESRATRNLKRAKNEDPARFQDMAPDKLTKLETGALLTLNMYITNIMSSDPSVPDRSTEKKISERNKTFLVQFGPECEELFLYLGFKKRQEADEAFYISPREPPHEGGKTDLYTERAFFEDVKSEIQSVIDQKFPQHVQPHSSARHHLEKALGCGDVHKLTPGHVNDDEQHCYCLLGASTSSTDVTLRWAYGQQIAVDPDHKRYYVQALSVLAYKKGEDLQFFAVDEIQKSAAASSSTTAEERNEYDSDWEWFGFSRAADRTSDNNKILQRYHEYRDQRRSQRHLHRLHLAKIGRDLQQQNLIDVAAKEMDEEEAYGVLGVSLSDDLELDSVANSAVVSVRNNEKDLAVVVPAMDIVGNKNSHKLGTDQYVEFERISGELTAHLGGKPQEQYIVGAFDETETKEGDLTLPAGLTNLRNTCYLNSILQYLYTVDVIRELLHKLELDTALEASTEKMGEILGTNVEESERKEAWLGHEFARELKTLFQEMEETTSVHVKPRQRLANAVFARAAKVSATEPKVTESKAAESTATESKEVPPPLPPRNGEEAAAVEHVETASVSSSQTLVGEATPAIAGTTGTKGTKGTKGTESIEGTEKREKREGTEKAGPVEDLAKELDKEEVKGTDQQDVDEAMGNILEHLQAAVKLARARHQVQEEDGKEEISDPVDDHIYSDSVIHSRTRGINTWNKRDDRSRLVMVPLHETKGVKEDLYQVIGRSMDAQLNEETKLMTFTAIKKPADIMHFLLPRSGQNGKNENPVELNDPLYLDHFMEVEDAEDQRFKRKARLWAINRRLEELRASKEKAGPEPNSEEVLAEEDMERFLEVDLQVDTDGDYELVDVNEGAAKGVQEGVSITPERLTEFSDWLRVEEATAEEKLRAEREAILANGTAVEYRLHAVFCHRGSTGYGHYWVWIKDFERGVWRKYNDNTVTLHTEQEFRRDAGCAPEPCWAAYVRAGKTGLVSVPLRKGVDKEQVEVKVWEMMAQKGEDTRMGGTREVSTSVLKA